MLIGIAADRIYLACGATDMRKSIDGLSALVQVGFDLDPFVGAWFVFCNRDRDKPQEATLRASRLDALKALSFPKTGS